MSLSDRYTPEQIVAMRKWAENWKRVGPLLEKIRHEELRALTEQQSWQNLESLAEFYFNSPENEPSKPTSGFVEQQRRFQKMRKP